MARYAVGDLQGCLRPLQCLLEEVAFDPQHDQLWLVGDLVNRGPDSLGTLRLVHSFGNSVRAVLGNHDLHLLAVAYGATHQRRGDTFDDILAAPDRDTLLDWLLHLPLLYSDDSGHYTLCHAGIPPIWSVAEAHTHARAVEAALRADPNRFFAHMYGNQPDGWSDDLQGWARLRVITNYFTRMRFCSADGRLDLDNKTDTPNKPGYLPWFGHQNRLSAGDAIIFGHWASLEGDISRVSDTVAPDNLFALDTGCVWGGAMTMMNLETQALHKCACPA